MKKYAFCSKIRADTRFRSGQPQNVPDSKRIRVPARRRGAGIQSLTSRGFAWVPEVWMARRREKRDRGAREVYAIRDFYKKSGENSRFQSFCPLIQAALPVRNVEILREKIVLF